jgi:hypothetical protein
VAVEEEREVENKMAPPVCVSRSAPSRRRVEASSAATGSPGGSLPRRPLFSTSPDRCLLRHFAAVVASDRMEAGRDDGAKRTRAAMVRCLRPLSPSRPLSIPRRWISSRSATNCCCFFLSPGDEFAGRSVGF